MADQFSNLYMVFTVLLIQLLVDRLLYKGFNLREWEEISDAMPLLESVRAEMDTWRWSRRAFSSAICVVPASPTPMGMTSIE